MYVLIQENKLLRKKVLNNRGKVNIIWGIDDIKKIL